MDEYSLWLQTNVSSARQDQVRAFADDLGDLLALNQADLEASPTLGAYSPKPGARAVCHASNLRAIQILLSQKLTEFLKQTLSKRAVSRSHSRKNNGRVLSLAPNERFQRAPGPR